MSPACEGFSLYECRLCDEQRILSEWLPSNAVEPAVSIVGTPSTTAFGSIQSMQRKAFVVVSMLSAQADVSSYRPSATQKPFTVPQSISCRLPPRLQPCLLSS